MQKSTILAFAIALATGAGSALAQSGTGGTSDGPPNSPQAPGTMAPSAPGPMPRDSGSSMGTGTMNPPTTVAPGTSASPQAPVPGVTQPPLAQPSTTPDQPSIATNPPAATMPGTGAPGEAQARARIERDGYKNVGPLTRGANGMWQGTALRGSTPVQVMVDARGNVVTQ